MDLAASGELVEQRLRRFFADAKLRAECAGPAYLELWEALERAAAGGARLLRSIEVPEPIHRKLHEVLD
ncbi:hypothetical protein CQ010_00290 [Arthrobacter sp. MYb211]|uniref:hypothetical protein n=1 Tax=Micrococcaceae TaxID=1268 RepID=UPI000CFC4E4F|nr:MULTISPECIES: hypothetical protein [unclassified Arthrobacter]PRA13127.1 hypothetical protein CQ015_02545 [Arthrobacter sp. MYb221]PRC10320.1 hypothetical protein CQ010_00290 [Arthrobacter sp. MYb211]